MEWIILFIVSIVLFILLVDWKTLKINIFCGLCACFMQVSIDWSAMNHNFYKVYANIHLLGSSIFFVFGPVIIIGILLAQYSTSKKWAKIINIFVLAGLFSLQEALLLSRKALVYLNWHYIDSIIVNICAMLVLSWFSIVILNKGKKADL